MKTKVESNNKISSDKIIDQQRDKRISIDHLFMTSKSMTKKYVKQESFTQQDSLKQITQDNNLDDSNMHFMNAIQQLNTQNINNTFMTQANDDTMVQDEIKQLNVRIDTENKNDFFESQSISQKNSKSQENIQQIQQVDQQSNETRKKKKNNEEEISNDESKNQSKNESIDVFEEQNNLNKDVLKITQKLNQLPFDQGSKTSIQSSSSSVLKSIIFNTTDKSTPPFISILNTVFFFQFLVFIIVVIVISITVSQSFSSYTDALNEMGRSAKLMIPINEALISSDILALSNEKMITLAKDSYSPLMKSHIKTGYADYAQNLFSFMEKYIQFDFQREFYKYDVSAEIEAYDKNERVPIQFTEFLKKAAQSLYDLSRDETQKEMTIIQNSRNILKNNLNVTYTLLHEVSLQINIDLSSLQDNIINVNTYSIVLAILLIVISFLFIIPSYKSLKFKTERILMIVSRMKEQETKELIQNLKSIGLKLFSNQDEYLHIDFSNLALREEQELVSSHRLQQATNSKKKKSRQNYLYDRIQDNQLKFYTFIIILVVLCLLSILFFLIVFLFLNEFKSTFGEPTERYKIYIEGMLCYSTVISSNNMILMNSLLINNNINYITNEKQQQVQSLRDTCYKSSRNYFSNQYNDIQNFGDVQNFRDKISSINQQQACELDILDNNYKYLCQTAQEGVLNRGLKQSITSTLDKINDQISLQDGFSYLFNSRDFQEGIIVQLLNIDLMRYILDLFETENKRTKDQFLTTLVLIVIIGSLIYVLIFFIVIGVYVRKLKEEYLIIKRAIQLIPYKRLTEDQQTLFIIFLKKIH